MTNYWVCWSINSVVRDSARKKAVIHLQGENSKTLCGISTKGYWDFEVHSDIDSVNCKRCIQAEERKMVA